MHSNENMWQYCVHNSRKTKKKRNIKESKNVTLYPYQNISIFTYLERWTFFAGTILYCNVQCMSVNGMRCCVKKDPFLIPNRKIFYFFLLFFTHSQIQYRFLFPLCVDFHLTFIKHAATSMTTHSVPFEFDTFCCELWRICAWVCLSTVQTIKHTGDWWCMRYAHFTHINSHITVATLEINGRNACNKVSFLFYFFFVFYLVCSFWVHSHVKPSSAFSKIEYLETITAIVFQAHTNYNWWQIFYHFL